LSVQVNNGPEKSSRTIDVDLVRLGGFSANLRLFFACLLGLLFARGLRFLRQPCSQVSEPHIVALSPIRFAAVGVPLILGSFPAARQQEVTGKIWVSTNEDGPRL
jgi:hypothetical protein